MTVYSVELRKIGDTEWQGSAPVKPSDCFTKEAAEQCAVNMNGSGYEGRAVAYEVTAFEVKRLPLHCPHCGKESV